MKLPRRKFYEFEVQASAGLFGDFCFPCSVEDVLGYTAKHACQRAARFGVHSLPRYATDEMWARYRARRVGSRMWKYFK